MKNVYLLFSQGFVEVAERLLLCFKINARCIIFESHCIIVIVNTTGVLNTVLFF